MIGEFRASRFLAPGLLVVAMLGCQRERAVEKLRKSEPSAAAATATPVDRLLPGELSASSQLVFGLPIPNGMRIERAFPDAVHLVGEVTVPGLVEYLRKHARIGAPELTATMLLFERVKIPSQGENRLYEFQILQRGPELKLLVKDVTRPELPSPPMSDEERWKRAGRKPDGAPLNFADLR